MAEQEILEQNDTENISSEKTEQEIDWKHKAEVEAGRLKKVARELAERDAQIDLLKRQQDEWLTKFTSPQQIQPDKQSYTPLNEVFEPEQVSAIENALSIKLSKIIQETRQPLDDIKEQFNLTKQRNYEMQLNALVPDYRDIIKESDFLNFLDNPEGHAGRTKHDSAIEAQNQGNALAVAKYLKEYLDSKKGSNKNKYVMPSGQGQSYTTPNDDKLQLKRGMYNDLYQKKRLGQISQKEFEKQKEILDAQLMNL